MALNDDESRYGYAKYEDFDNYSYSIISYLMDNNEMIWKLLKYMTPDAWEQSNLTKVEKGALIYKGQEDGSKYRVFMDDGLPDVQTREDAILRISPYTMFPENRTVGTTMIRFECYSHFKVNHLSNYKTRIDMIVKEILGTLNGIVVPTDSGGNIGRLHFDRLASTNARLETSGQIPFKGKVFYMGNKSN